MGIRLEDGRTEIAHGMSRANTILLVDADEATLRYAGVLFENEGYRVVTARDGDEALVRLRESRPDVVVLEILLPRRNGYQVCRAIREDAVQQHLPVLFLSAKSQPSDRFWAKRVGADGFVAKPFDPADLLREIRALLQKAQAAAP